jgi:phosphoribosylaminoimidazolecarboxamide formyltransferase / IMP cyclohydrolase
MIKIKRALISVSDKTGIAEFAKELAAMGVEILSTGGTAKLLREQSIPVKEVSAYTGFPEMLDGRVKTLHPMIHGGLLALRDNPDHMQQIQKHGIGLIDMVVVNLYPFERTIQKPGVSIEEAIENIDIGGPSMLRSAAKNHASVAVICNPAHYSKVIKEMKASSGSVSVRTMQELGIEVYRVTSQYDQAIHTYLNSRVLEGETPAAARLPKEITLHFTKLQDLRYGENPHQAAAWYRDSSSVSGLAEMKQLWGKELSFNNILDVNSAVALVREFSLPAVAFIKHNNPCGCAENKSLLKAFQDAWQCDTLSAFGGIVAINRKVDAALAKRIAKCGFLECIVCPEFSFDALEVLKEKKNVRLLELPSLAVAQKPGFDYKKVAGGLLLQDEDSQTYLESSLKVVTRKKPTKAQMASLLFAWKVAKHVKSNAIVLAQGTKTVGIGAGQMSRVDSVFISTKKAGRSGTGAVLASDAFFPKEDAVSLAAKYKVKAIIQPGGSIADELIIKTADKHKIPMVLTGMRHFRH